MIRVFCLVTGHWNLWASAHSKNIIYFSWRLTDLYFWQLMQFFTRPILCKFQLKECGACRQVLQRTIRYRTKSQIPIIRLSVIWQKRYYFSLVHRNFLLNFCDHQRWILWCWSSATNCHPPLLWLFCQITFLLAINCWLLEVTNYRLFNSSIIRANPRIFE